jgi:hypothetical protein
MNQKPGERLDCDHAHDAVKVGDIYNSPLGPMTVDWVCDSQVVGLSGDGWTWTGFVGDMAAAGLVRRNGEGERLQIGGGGNNVDNNTYREGVKR